MTEKDWTPEEEEAFNAIEKQSNLGKQILQDMKLEHTPTHIRLDKQQISRLMALSGLSAHYYTVRAYTRLVERLIQGEKPRTWVGLTDEEARVKFESWHKAEYVQPLERYGHTYKNMHVRNRWQGWLAANGIKEKNT